MRPIAQWLAALPPQPGDAVYDVADPRHVGTLEKLLPVTVRWHDTGWSSDRRMNRGRAGLARRGLSALN